LIIFDLDFYFDLTMSFKKQSRLKQVSNYTLFTSEFRKNNPGIQNDFFKRVGEAWKILSTEEKSAWKEKADSKNEIFKQEYINQHGGLPEKHRKTRKQRRTNPFQVFASDFREKNSNISPREFFRETSTAWWALSEVERKDFIERSERKNKIHGRKFQQEKIVNAIISSYQIGLDPINILLKMAEYQVPNTFISEADQNNTVSGVVRSIKNL